MQFCEAGGLDVRYILESHVHGEIAAVVAVVVQFGMKAASLSRALKVLHSCLLFCLSPPSTTNTYLQQPIISREHRI